MDNQVEQGRRQVGARPEKEGLPSTCRNARKVAHLRPLVVQAHKRLAQGFSHVFRKGVDV